MTARGAAAVSGGLALAGMAAVVLSSANLAPAWPSAVPTAIGLWSIDVFSSAPIGNPLHRAAAAAACLSAIAGALTAMLLARLGYGPVAAVGAALTIGLLSYAKPALATHLPSSLAAALTVGAVLVASGRGPLRAGDREPGRSLRARVMAAAVQQALAGAFQPATLAALPLVVAHARDRSMLTRTLAGAFGFVVVAWWVGGSTSSVDAAGLGTLGQPWLWPVAVVVITGALAPLWGGRVAGTGLVGTGVMVPLAAMGHPVSALAVFPALLLAAGIVSLGSPGRGRAVVVAGLVTISLAEARRVPPPPTWPLVAWRDAVERAVPAGSRLYTGNRAAAALNGPLFRGRPTRIEVIPSARAAGLDSTAPRFLLEDLARAEPSGERLSPVPVGYAGAADFVARLPERTIVGVALAASVAEVGPDALHTVLALLGHRNPPAGPTMVAAGLVGGTPAAGLVRSDGRLHVLIGDPIGAEGQRSPTDFDLRSAADGVSVRLRGRVLATGRRWAVVAIRPGGPLIEAMADGDGDAPWPIRLPGLQVWRESP